MDPTFKAGFRLSDNGLDDPPWFPKADIDPDAVFLQVIVLLDRDLVLCRGLLVVTLLFHSHYSLLFLIYTVELVLQLDLLLIKLQHLISLYLLFTLYLQLERLNIS